MSKPYARIKRVYRSLPTVECQGLCHQACGPIGMAKSEADQLAKHGTAIEHDNGSCPYLTKGKRCSAYKYRPLVCRLYGATEDLPCEHGCKPVISSHEARVALHAVRLIDSRLSLVCQPGLLPPGEQA